MHTLSLAGVLFSFSIFPVALWMGCHLQDVICLSLPANWIIICLFSLFFFPLFPLSLSLSLTLFLPFWCLILFHGSRCASALIKLEFTTNRLNSSLNPCTVIGIVNGCKIVPLDSNWWPFVWFIVSPNANLSLNCFVGRTIEFAMTNEIAIAISIAIYIAIAIAISIFVEIALAMAISIDWTTVTMMMVMVMVVMMMTVMS